MGKLPHNKLRNISAISRNSSTLLKYQTFRRSGLSVLECRIVKKLYTFTRFGKLDVLKNVEETVGYKIAMGLLENVKITDNFTVFIRLPQCLMIFQ